MIDVGALLKRRITLMLPKLTEATAKKARESVLAVTKVWRKTVWDWMSTTPAVGMPTHRTGALQKALFHSTSRLRKISNTHYQFTINYGWNPVMSKATKKNPKGNDYGAIINKRTRVAGYRERISDSLEQAIDKVYKK